MKHEARVLIADDDSLVRANLRESLEELGYLVVGEANNGKVAISMIRQLRPDVVLTDVKMPYMGGIEMAKMLRDEMVAPIILISSSSSRELAQQACLAGVHGYLLKPVQESELRASIEVARARWNEYCTRYHELGKLRALIENRDVIEQAKEHLMDNYGLRESEAFRKIQRLAMNNRKTMKEVAQAIILTSQLQDRGMYADV